MCRDHCSCIWFTVHVNRKWGNRPISAIISCIVELYMEKNAIHNVLACQGSHLSLSRGQKNSSICCLFNAHNWPVITVFWRATSLRSHRKMTAVSQNPQVLLSRRFGRARGQSMWPWNRRRGAVARTHRGHRGGRRGSFSNIHMWSFRSALTNSIFLSFRFENLYYWGANPLKPAGEMEVKQHMTVAGSPDMLINNEKSRFKCIDAAVVAFQRDFSV